MSWFGYQWELVSKYFLPERSSQYLEMYIIFLYYLILFLILIFIIIREFYQRP